MTTSLSFKTATTFFDNSYLRTLVRNYGTEGYTAYNPEEYKLAASKKGFWRVVDKVNAFIQKLFHYIHSFFSPAYRNQFCYVAKVISDEKNNNPSEENLKELEEKLIKACNIQSLHANLRSIWADPQKKVALKGLGLEDLCISDDFVEMEKKRLRQMSEKVGGAEKKDPLVEKERFFKDLASVDPIFKEIFSLLLNKFSNDVVRSWNPGVLKLSKVLKFWVPSETIPGGNVFLLGQEVRIKLDKGKILFEAGYNNYCRVPKSPINVFITSSMFSFEIKGESIEFYGGVGPAKQRETQKLSDLREKWGRGEVLGDGEKLDLFLKQKMTVK